MALRTTSPKISYRRPLWEKTFKFNHRVTVEDMSLDVRLAPGGRYTCGVALFTRAESLSSLVSCIADPFVSVMESSWHPGSLIHR